jgi:uncharacterized repeat protein (TIGR03803 family)
MVVVAAGLTSAGAAKTQGAYGVFHSFLVVDFPLGTLIQGADGNLYGTTFEGGFFRNGTVFRMTTGGALTYLHEFTGADGATPRAGLLQAADGNLYGTTFSGTDFDLGTVFRMTPDGSLTVLHQFSGPEGAHPLSTLIQGTDGNFYGTTSDGGAFSMGTIFRMSADGAVTTLHEFTGGADGAIPVAGLVQGRDGNFYGTTQFGGDVTNNGTVFSITADGQLTVLHAFTGSPDGAAPAAALIQANDGNFYGTTQLGGDVTNNGTVFSITADGLLTVLHAFTGSPDGAGPAAALTQANDGTIYGTTQFGGAFFGTVFSITVDGRLTVLHSFASRFGDGNPVVGVVQATDGNFYGTTTPGFPPGRDSGTAFRMTPTGTFTELNAVFGEGRLPTDLIQATDGNFYGITSCAGPNDCRNTIYRLTSAGSVMILTKYNAQGDDFIQRVIQATDGKLYGTTFHGGAFGHGTVFTMTLNGDFTVLHEFNGEDGGAPSPIVQANDGYFYGTTFDGGTFGRGTVFRISPGGSFTIVHSFTGGADGAGAFEGLIQASDGNFYGIGATSDRSNPTFFRMSPAGVVTVLRVFSAFEAGPSRPIQASDGNFYGTMSLGGVLSRGAIYQLTPAGSLTILHEFIGQDGAYPEGLVQGRDGLFYGTTNAGGTTDNGVIYQITPAGGFATLHLFTGAPDDGGGGGILLQANDGNLYGTAGRGGANDGGVVFRLTPP